MLDKFNATRMSGDCRGYDWLSMV